jgi:LPXTG-motif cell wall-anchored protein
MSDEAPPKTGSAWPIAFAVIGIGLIALAGFIFKSCLDQPARMAETMARATQPQISVNTVIQTSLERLREESKLVVYTADVAVMVTKVSDKKVLYGKLDLGTTVVRVRASGNKAQLIIPLNELSENDIQFKESENKFVVTLPAPRVDETLVEVQTDPKFYEVQTELGWARLDRFSGEFLREEAKRELRGSVIAEASDPRIIEAARQNGREQIAGLLEAVVKPMRPEATVAVEFKEEAAKR